MTRSTPAPAVLDLARLAPESGSRIVIVGGCGGIGAALATGALRLGMEVVNLDLARAIATRPPDPRVRSIAIDLRDPASFAAAAAELASRWTSVDAAVYLSGFSPPPHPVASTTLDEWDEVLDVNLRGAFVAAKHLAPLLSAGAGSLVLVSSGLAANVERGWSAYSASKAGLTALGKVLAKELAPAVRVNVVAPGPVDTPFLSGGTGRTATAAADGDSGWFAKSGFGAAILQTIPLQRIAVPDDVVAPIIFLLGPGARYITGQTLYVNGGRYMP